jgi:ketosteroid isomerase-like protein
MSQRTEIERAINLFIDAINRNDASQIPLTEDVIMSGPMMAEPTVGEAEVRNYLNETSPFIAHLDLRETLIEGDRAAIIVKFTGINGVVIEGAEFFTFRDGKIASDHIYFDTRRLFKGAN